MRFSVAAVFGLAAFATAQNSTSSAAATTSAAPTAEQRCLTACGTDICCQARCVNVPCPSDLQANATTDCAAKCPQGNGSPSDTEQYARCQQACISSLFFPLSATAGPSGSGGSSQATPTGNAGGSGSGSGPSATGNSASGSASPTGNAASEVRFGATGAGLLGLFVAGLVL